MICPMQTIPTGSNSARNPTVCQNVDCGWWDQANEQCSILTIKNALVKISEKEVRE